MLEQDNEFGNQRIISTAIETPIRVVPHSRSNMLEQDNEFGNQRIISTAIETPIRVVSHSRLNMLEQRTTNLEINELYLRPSKSQFVDFQIRCSPLIMFNIILTTTKSVDFQRESLLVANHRDVAQRKRCIA